MTQVKAEYLEALERQARWARWTKSPDFDRFVRETLVDGARRHGASSFRQDLDAAYGIPIRKGDLYYVNPEFCELLEHMCEGMPDISFRREMVPSTHGFVWFARPLRLPHLVNPHMQGFSPYLRAAGWRAEDEVDGRKWMVTNPDGTTEIVPAGRHVVFASYMTSKHDGDVDFSATLNDHPIPWTYFSMQDGISVDRKIRQFETTLWGTPDEKFRKENGYGDDQTYHEIRLVMCLLRIMEQKLVVPFTLRPERRSERRRVEKAARKANIGDKIKVIMYRRYANVHEQDDDIERSKVQWRGHWWVRGHWRHYRREGREWATWVEAYTKGPLDKPLIGGGDVRRIFTVER